MVDFMNNKKNDYNGDIIFFSTILILLVIGIIGFFFFRENVILELAIIGFIGDLLWELFGTNNGWWKYKKSRFFMIKDVPIEIPFLVFSIGMGGATMILFLLTLF